MLDDVAKIYIVEKRLINFMDRLIDLEVYTVYGDLFLATSLPVRN